MITVTKVFGIGFHKTVTTSLSAALNILGYSVCGSFGVNDPRIGKRALRVALKYAKRYSAFQDNPWPLLYKEMDVAFPGSRFILTVRDMDTWIRSVVNHFGEKSTPMREWIYGVGVPLGNESKYIERHERHVKEVLDYVNKRQEDLLILRIVAGEGWPELCSFLNKSRPDRDFPHVIPSPSVEHSILRGLRKSGRRLLRELTYGLRSRFEPW